MTTTGECIPKQNNSIGDRVTRIRAVLVVIGIAMVAAALAADWLGIGSDPGFGISQILLATVGLGSLLSGFALGIAVVPRWAKRFIFSKAGLVLGGLFVGLLASELSLRVVEFVNNPWVRTETNARRQVVPDPKLGIRLAAHTGGHDGKGFRNDTVPGQVDIVAIGDSQTWGENAIRSEAWPQTLARLSGLSVYNMALGGYGPVHYWALLEEALELSPKMIVIGLYFGNDLYDAYVLAHGHDAYAGFRNESVAGDLMNDTVTPRIRALKDAWEEFLTRYRWSLWLAHQSAVVRLLYNRGWWPTSIEPWKEYRPSKAWAFAFPDHAAVYEQGDVRTVFTTTYRLLALELDEPRITEGLRITKQMIRRIHARTEARGVHLLVMLIPTKEMVHKNALRRLQGQLTEAHSRLVQMELRAKAEILSLCKDHAIECLDGLPVLEQAVEQCEQIYPSGRDGHPNARGYFLIASAVNQALARNGW